MSDPEPEDTEYGLLMPFVTVTSKGGPHDDNAYVAGFEMGVLDDHLGVGHPFHEATIRTDNVPQADLIAMHRGYRFEHRASDDVPEWAFATFTRITPEEPTA